MVALGLIDFVLDVLIPCTCFMSISLPFIPLTPFQQCRRSGDLIGCLAISLASSPEACCLKNKTLRTTNARHLFLIVLHFQYLMALTGNLGFSLEHVIHLICPFLLLLGHVVSHYTVVPLSDATKRKDAGTQTESEDDPVSQSGSEARVMNERATSNTACEDGASKTTAEVDSFTLVDNPTAPRLQPISAKHAVSVSFSTPHDFSLHTTFAIALLSIILQLALFCSTAYSAASAPPSHSAFQSHALVPVILPMGISTFLIVASVSEFGSGWDAVKSVSSDNDKELEWMKQWERAKTVGTWSANVAVVVAWGVLLKASLSGAKVPDVFGDCVVNIRYS